MCYFIEDLRSKHAIQLVASPANEGADRPGKCPHPAYQNKACDFGITQRLANNSTHDDSIAVPRDEHKSCDLAVAEKRTCNSNSRNGKSLFENRNGGDLEWNPAI